MMLKPEKLPLETKQVALDNTENFVTKLSC